MRDGQALIGQDQRFGGKVGQGQAVTLRQRMTGWQDGMGRDMRHGCARDGRGQTQIPGQGQRHLAAQQGLGQGVEIQNLRGKGQALLRQAATCADRGAQVTLTDDDGAFVLSARHIPGDLPDAALWRALASAAGGRLDDEGGSHWRLRLPYGTAPATSPDPA